MWRTFISTTFCTVCLKECWNRERVVNHFRSKVCQNQLLLRGAVCTEEKASELDAVEAASNAALHKIGNRRHKACRPVLQAQGPLLPMILDDDHIASRHHPLGRGHNYHR